MTISNMTTTDLLASLNANLPTYSPKERLGMRLKAMRGIVENAKAAGRELTGPEVAALEAANDEVDNLRAKIEQAAKSAAIMDRIGGTKHESYDATTGEPIVRGRDGWGKKAVEALSGLAATLPGGAKSLTSGNVSVPSIVSPVLIDAAPRTLLDLIPVVDPNRGGSGVARADDDGVDFVGRSSGRVGNGFSYLRQSLRTNNAGAVPDGAAKPTSEYTFGQVNDTFRVYANKTEDLAWRYLDDFADLTDILQAQLREDTLAAIEADVLSGDGLEDRFTGILETTGAQVQAFTGDLLDTLRTAKYKLLSQERALTGWALNPLDLMALEALRENGATGAFLFKSRADIEGFLGAPVVTSLGLPVGQAIAADWTQAELLPVGDDELVFDGTNRTKNNTFLLMFEGRYGFRVKKPFDFVKVSLTEA